MTPTKKGLYLTVEEIREIAKSSKDANEAMQECLLGAARKEQQHWMLEHINKIEITHIPDEEEKPKWEGAPFEVMYPNPFDYPLAPRAEAFWKGKPEVNAKDWLEEHMQDIPSAGECVAFISKGIDKEIEIAKAMTPYNTLAINGFIDNELWWKIYKSLRKSFGNEK